MSEVLKEFLDKYGVEEVSPDSEWETSDEEIPTKVKKELQSKKSKTTKRSYSLEKDVPKRERYT